MSEPKFYAEGGIDFAFVPEGGPFEGRLVTRFPEVPPYVANIKLSSSRSRTTYAREAAEYCGVDESDLKAALIGVCALRSEEVAAAQDAEQAEPDPEEALPEVSQEDIDERVGRPGVLDRFVEAAAACSKVIAERKPLGLISLGAFSAQLEKLPSGKPLGANVILTSPAGRGKNYLCDAVARQLPEEFCFPFESASAKALYYLVGEDPEFLRHRWIYPNDAEGTDLLVETLRPLLSGGSARHVTVNKDASGRNVGQEFTVEGPVSVTIPTIRNKLDNQLQSRMLIADLKDYEGRVGAHSLAVSEQLSPGYVAAEHDDDILPWRQALRSLTAVRRVVLPVEDERFRFDSDEVPHGARLWTNMLGLMCAHAWLEQRNRELIELPGGGQAVVASAEDYEAAYQIFKATCERSVLNLSKTHKKILDAMHRLQKELEDRSAWLSWTGLTQHKIAQAAGVSQSTVSGNKTFLVKSAKLVREVGEGGLALVKDAEPSWWHSGDALLGFPKPEEVRAWWAGNDPTPPSPEGADRTDHEGDTALEAASEAVNGDRRDADQERETDDHYEKKGAAQGDRRAEAGDRRAADRKNGLHKDSDSPKGGAIGVIGSSGMYSAGSSELATNQVDGARKVSEVPLPPTRGAAPAADGHIGLENGNVTADEEDSTRITRLEEVLRRRSANPYGVAASSFYTAGMLIKARVFDELDFTPTEREVQKARIKLWRSQGGTYRGSEIVLKPLPIPENDTPPEDAGVWYTAGNLRVVVSDRKDELETDPIALIDAVAALDSMFFVPTLEEMTEAMRMRGLEGEPGCSSQKPEVSPPPGASSGEVSDVERAMRRAQRAPRSRWPENSGEHNSVQDWVMHRGDMNLSWYARRTLPDVADELQEKGFLPVRPSEREVEQVLNKMVQEMKDAEARHKERCKQKHRSTSR
jgi:hypothetical protein